MSAAQSEVAVDRVAAKRRELGESDFSAYAFLALGLLAWNAPDVLGFILDRTDERVELPPAPVPHHLWGDDDGLVCKDPGHVHGHGCNYAASQPADDHVGGGAVLMKALTVNEADLVQSLLPTAAALACAVTDGNRGEIRRLLASVDPRVLPTLTVLLAARVDPDKPFRPTATYTDIPVVPIVRAAAIRFGITEHELRSVVRSRAVVDARSVACYASRLAGMTLTDIGKYVRRDHSTVLHSVTRVGEDARLRRVANAILADLGYERSAEHDEVLAS